MGWVTLDDGQKVLIAGGKVYATRAAISSVSGGGERGRALATRSKTAIGGVSARTARAIEHARAAGPVKEDLSVTLANQRRKAEQDAKTAKVQKAIVRGIKRGGMW